MTSEYWAAASAEAEREKMNEAKSDMIGQKALVELCDETCTRDCICGEHDDRIYRDEMTLREQEQLRIRFRAIKGEISAKEDFIETLNDDIQILKNSVSALESVKRRLVSGEMTHEQAVKNRASTKVVLRGCDW